MSKQAGMWRTRAAGEPEDLRTRSLSVRLDAGGRPGTLDEAERSVEVVGATETPVRTYDWELGGFVDEILLMSGCRMPADGQLVLLDSHSRFDTASVIGSFRQMRIEGDQLVGRAVFTSQPEGVGPFTKLREGHLRDFSIGYKINAYTRVEAGKTASVEGRTFTGPALVATDWEPKELSVCPIGADPNAKARGAARSEDMNKRLREFLESRGLPAAASEEEAWAYLQTMQTLEARAEGGVDGNGANGQPPAGAAAGTAGPSDDDEGTRAAGAVLERQRATEILAMGRRFDCAELAETCIKEGVSLDQARQKVLDHVAGKRAKGPGFTTIEMVADENGKFRSAMGDALALRAGFALEKPAPGAQDLRGLTLREACREALRISGARIPHHPMEMVGRALTTSDLPALLVDTANRSLMAGYAAANETYPLWVDDSGTVSDFKIHTMARAGEADDLEEIPEGGEYSYGSQDETKETYKVGKYGRMFAITREAIINDDLGAITDVPRQHGEAAARKIGDIAYAVLVANAAMGDGYALFHAKHNNLLGAADVTVASLGAGETAMGLQKDIRGLRRLNIPVRFLVRAFSKKTATEQFFMTQLIGGAANQPNLTNPWYGERIVRVYEPRLDDDSLTAWYLAGPKGSTVKLFFLNGMREPYLETRQGWSVDGTEYKVRLEAGAKALDWRTMTKNPGA